MRKLVNIASVVLVALVLLGVAAAGYLWYTTKQQVDQFVTMTKPFAEISYGGIDISPTGSVGVNRLRIMPHFANDAITIGSIRLKASNFVALLHTHWQLSRNQLPGALALSFQDVALPLGSGMAGASSTQTTQSSPLDHLNALGCGPVATFRAADWQAMGYDRFAGSMEMGYHLNPKDNVLNLRMDSHSRGWATLDLDVGLALTKSPESLMELTFFTPRLAKLNLVLRDDGFNQRRNNYCAAQAGKTIPAYLADYVRQVADRLRANGIVPGPGLLDAYQRYLSGSSVLTIAATPPAPINPAELPEYAPADLVRLLGLTMAVNESPVADLTMDWDAAKVAKALGVAQEPKSEPEASSISPVPRAPVMVQKTYHSTPVDALDRHVGQIAKLRTKTGVQYHGQLDAVAEGFVRITVRKSGGSATLSLRAGEISTAEVLY